jgi:hypothetical protein
VSRLGVLSDPQRARLTKVATELIPNTPDAPGPGGLPEYDQLLQQACNALDRDWDAVQAAIERLPSDISWSSLAAYADESPDSFELVALVLVGAYFMSPSVLTSLGIPPGPRRRAPHDQAANELGTGILDAVLERGSPVKTLADIDEKRKPDS